ncbi:hypothetical protein HUU05_07525 [candidate division KSB1 bacterium]|nr:hypothetical protein [candidate division KSB1 bacterium]
MRSFILFLFVALTSGVAFAQIRFSGSNHIEYSHNSSDDVARQAANRRDFFEDWTEGHAQYRRWRLGLRVESHNAPPIFAPDQTIRKAGLTQRFIEYEASSLKLTLGHFYSLLGRGLTLRFYENRQLRHDARIDGFKGEYVHKYFEAKLLAGQPINRENQRQKIFEAGELKLKPFKAIHLGGTMLTTHPDTKRRVSWGSFYAEINAKHGSIYGEYAQEDDPNAAQAPPRIDQILGKRSGAGAAWYVNANILLGAFSLSAEYKDYEDFEQFEGAYFNNPPLVAREHLYTLLNRHQLVQDADDEKGYAFEAAYPVIKDGVFTAQYSRTNDQAGAIKYEEYYSQFEWTTPFDWEWFLAVARQDDPSARYLNFVNSTTCALSDFNALKIVYEHQHTKKFLDDQQFYDQALTVGFSHAPSWTLSFLGERTTEHRLQTDYWLGGQLDWNFLKNFDLSLFAGSRRKGKVCAGGVCVIKPELEGVEVTLITRF